MNVPDGEPAAGDGLAPEGPPFTFPPCCVLTMASTVVVPAPDRPPGFEAAAKITKPPVEGWGCSQETTTAFVGLLAESKGQVRWTCSGVVPVPVDVGPAA